MRWQRTTMGRLECDLGAYRGVVERLPADGTWQARVETREQTYTSIYEYPTMRAAQDWVEAKLEALLRQRMDRT